MYACEWIYMGVCAVMQMFISGIPAVVYCEEVDSVTALKPPHTTWLRSNKSI